MKKYLRSKLFWALLVFAGGLCFKFWQEYQLVKAEPISAWQQDIQADCAVVLTGGAGRVREGFDLLATGRVRKLIISGVHANSRLREILPMWPFYGNLKEEDVILERRSETTFGNAQQSLPIVEALGCRDIVLITSRAHMRRSYLSFRSAFPEQIFIYRRAVVSGGVQSSRFENLVEAAKIIFYSFWAF